MASGLWLEVVEGLTWLEKAWLGWEAGAGWGLGLWGCGDGRARQTTTTSKQARPGARAPKNPPRCQCQLFSTHNPRLFCCCLLGHFICAFVCVCTTCGFLAVQGVVNLSVSAKSCWRGRGLGGGLLFELLVPRRDADVWGVFLYFFEHSIARACRSFCVQATGGAYPVSRVPTLSPRQLPSHVCSVLVRPSPRLQASNDFACLPFFSRLSLPSCLCLPPPHIQNCCCVWQ